MTHDFSIFTGALLFPAGKCVRAYPGVGDGETRCDAEPRQVGRERPLEEIRTPAHCILRLAYVQAFGKETCVVRCLGKQSKMLEYK